MIDSTPSFIVALVQQAPVFLNLDATVERAVATTREAAGNGARAVVFPETWFPGYPVWIDAAPRAALWDDAGAKVLYRLLAENSLEVGGGAFERLGAVSDETETVLAIGAHERLGASLYNTTVLFDGRGGHVLHRKLTPTYTERLLWGQGDGSTLEAIDTDLGVVGNLICWEHWMPLARAAMHAQHELLHVAQWPWVRELHQLCSRQYAFEGQCFVAASGGVLTRGQMLEGFASVGSGEQAAGELLESIPGDDATLLLEGGSTLIGPDSTLISTPVYGSETIVYGQVDPSQVVEGRMYLDTDGHYSRSDVFRLEIDTRSRANVSRRSVDE